MLHTRYTRLTLIAAAAVPLLLIAAENVDLSVINRIKTEAFEHSKVMDHMFYLTDVNGPRLTGSPNYKAAGDWAVARLKEYGLANVKQEKWGPFGRGWANKHFEAAMVEPQYSPLIGVVVGWTASTDGTVTGEPMMVSITKEADFDKYTGKLKGKVLMTQPMPELAFPTNPQGHRYTSEELLAEALSPLPGPSALGPRRGNFPGFDPNMTPEERRKAMEERRKLQEKISEFYKTEGVIAEISPGRGEGGTVFGPSPRSYDVKTALPLPSVVLAAEHYNRISRLLAHKIPVKLALNIQNEIIDQNQDSFNITGEIPGTTKKDEIVMVGGHFDSWNYSTGATDNAAGSAVAMEVVRILKAANLPMDRTVRIGLWGGEEEGLLGSHAYVKEHFADPEVMKPTAEHAKISGYFNLDNGTGKIRGVYLQGNDMMRPIFESWFVPFKDLGAQTITIRNTGGTDHQSFDGVGIPGFQFIQDPMDYSTRTHHSNMDNYDRIQAGDMMQSAAIMASFVYNTATRSEMLPRKPLPKPQPRRRGAEGGPPSTAENQ
jgi:carboxypeptidase Q